MKTLLALLLFVSINSFAQQNEFSWLIGTWQEEGKSAFEVWKVDNGYLSAESYVTKDGNKKVTEVIKLIKKGNDFYYIPDISGPQGSIEFKITSFDKSSFTAENPAHDFPKKIIYKKVDDTRLEASIGDGKRTIPYFFHKIK